MIKLNKVVTDVITTLNFYSAEIITLGLVICGGGMMVGSIFGKTNTWVSKRYATMDNSHLSQEHSRIYGKPIGQILDQIREREKLIYMEA